ncbi:unnamed protein product [Cercopithifilaria johnstoni]|uniref:Uncharacterized protein n=1 Tax=Cercopithifilaria johnstoni TaxID=2874296 RepID=A0A8J2M848_9BILA|nr:unnamed protein product [Cercopithifilaria johnstoni]
MNVPPLSAVLYIYKRGPEVPLITLQLFVPGQKYQQQYYNTHSIRPLSSIHQSIFQPSIYPFISHIRVGHLFRRATCSILTAFHSTNFYYIMAIDISMRRQKCYIAMTKPNETSDDDTASMLPLTKTTKLKFEGGDEKGVACRDRSVGTIGMSNEVSVKSMKSVLSTTDDASISHDIHMKSSSSTVTTVIFYCFFLHH